MKRKKLTRMLSAFLAATMVFTMSELPAGKQADVKAAVVSGSESANFDFESDLEGWNTTGTVSVASDGAKSGGKYLHLEPGATASMMITDVEQGSYTLSAWLKGTAGKNAKITVSETGGPDSVALIDTYMQTTEWTQMGHRNVLVYNEQLQITITAGTTAVDVDKLELALDLADANTIANWDLENGLDFWKTDGTAVEDTANADTGAKAVKLSAESEISQTISVEPNTRYSLTMRAKVDKQDTFETEKVTNYRGTMGELQERTSLGNRVNLGVRTTEGTVLRQAPAGTEGYSLVTLTFQTGAEDTEVEIYANTKYDQNYKDSVTLYKTEGTELADDWKGNGEDFAYVDNFDIFRIQDENYLRGADVSFLPLIEDLGGTYYANGVRQDCLRILSNHGVNSITNMIFVKAGEAVRDNSTCEVVYQDWWTKEDGSAYEYAMPTGPAGAYFDKEHSLELGKRATELGMSYLPSFHYSDSWMSNAKAYTPMEWLDANYEGTYSNTDLAHMQSIVYNYVYDFIKTLSDNDVNVCGVKHGNEQNGGIVWPVGKGSTTQGHALLIAASYEASEDAMPGICGYVHSNNGYASEQIAAFFGGLKNNGAKMDSLAFSLYGGRSIGNILTFAKTIAADENYRYMDYVNVETGFSFTRYQPTVDTANSAMGMTDYYNLTPNGQYNWLLDYMQAAIDTPNPYGQTRGFYYWETDWIPTPGAGSSAGGSADVNQRIMFNNGDTSIKEMGSTQDGRAGDMMDSMYAYLMRGCPKEKAATMQTSARDAGDYTVEVAEPDGIMLSKSELTLAEGKKERLQPTVTPVDKVLTDSNVTYTSADPSIATVTQDGFVCAVKEGTTTVTAEVTGNLKATVDVHVTAAKKAEGITLTVDDEDVTEGDTKTAQIFDKLQMTSSLSGAPTDTAVVYTSSNPKVAFFLGETWQTPDGQMRQETEKDTKVQLNVNEAGTTTITAASADGSVSVSFTLNTTKVDAESVTIDEEEISISYGRKKQLSATVAPKNTSRYKINWKSSDISIATVDENGLVIAKGVGDAVITASSDDNAEVKDICTVHVLPVQVEGVSIDKSSLTMQIGSTKTLKALITPADADNKNVNWTSDAPEIAFVNENGQVTANAIGGPVTITATTENGNFTATCKVTVQEDAIPVTGVEVSEEEYYFVSDYFSENSAKETAPTYRLYAEVFPESATDTDVTWESDTPEVAVVDEFGFVTAVSGGVATITATTKDGAFTSSAKVYVPSVSESFDNREETTGWGTVVGAGNSNKAAIMAGTVVADGENHIYQMTASGNGGRSVQKNFAHSISNDKVVVDFDWNVGAPSGTKGEFITITDSSNHSYLSLQSGNGAELVYSVGGRPTDGALLENTTPVGEGFNVKNTWYHIHAVIDQDSRKVSFTVSSLANEELSASHEVSFDTATNYTGDVSAIAIYAIRRGAVSWTTALDNVNIYKAAAEVKSITVSQNTVKLIPITDTLQAGCQISATAYPLAAKQEFVWKSSDDSVATVDENGKITAAKTYDSLEKIKTGSCTVKVSVKNHPEIYKEITVNISNSPNAFEFFSIKDEEGTVVYPVTEGSGGIALESGDRKQYFPVLTGGDGNTDIAGIKWESDNSSVVRIDEATGKLTAVGAGTANVTLTVTLYAGTPVTATLKFNVSGEALADTYELESAIKAAEAAKTEADEYYTPDSVTAYHQALEQAKTDLASAISEKWSSSKQSVLDADVAALKAAVEGLVKDTEIRTIEISGADTPISVHKTAVMTADIAPVSAEEKVIWSSKDPEIAYVKADGTVIALKAGNTVITAASASGKVTAEKEITVTSDLTSYYEQNGVTITSTNAARDATLAFINARTMNLAGANNGYNAWTTGSATKLGEIVVDLGEEVKIDNVTTCFWSLLKYTLDVSEDGQNWTIVVDHSSEAAGALSSGTEAYVDTFPENTYSRYVRLNVLENGGTGWIGVTVFQINGEYSLRETIPTDIRNAVVTLEQTEYEYDGTEKKPSVTLTLDDKTIDPESYEVTYTNNINPGTATVTVTATGDAYTGSVTADFTIKEKENGSGSESGSGSENDSEGNSKEAFNIQNAAVALEQDSYEYDGTEKKPAVTLTANREVIPASGYTAVYTNNVNAGTATVTITGTGSYTGSISKNFTIYKSSANIKIKNPSIQKAYNSKNFSVGAVSADGSKLTYKLSSSKVIKLSGEKVKPLAMGKVTVTVTSLESANYFADQEKITVTITPKKVSIVSVKSKKSGQAAVKWQKDSKAGGYEITYASNKQFKKAKTVKVKSAKTVNKTLTKLSKGKTCYIKVRAYKSISGKKIYGEYSAVKTVKVKK